MQTVVYKRWCPPASPLQIEFRAELPRRIRARATGDRLRGFLFGTRKGTEIRILAVRPRADARDETVASMQRVGICVYRERGEVFLTDRDLAAFEKHGAAIALVVTGTRAGFFVREANGSIQAVRSHEEFPLAEPASPLEIRKSPATVNLPAKSKPSRPSKPLWRWPAIAACLLAVPFVGYAYLEPRIPKPPVELSIEDAGGQLLIGWDAAAAAQGARLDISDQGMRTSLFVFPNTSGATYQHRSSEVEVRITSGSRVGVARWSSTRALAQVPPVQPAPPPEVKVLRTKIDQLEQRASQLSQSIRERRARVEDLTAQTRQLLLR